MRIYTSKDVSFLKEVGIVKRCDNLGRVVIPKEIVKSLSFEEGQKVDVYICEQGICIKRVIREENVFGLIKSIDKLNRIVIPKSIRKKTNINEETYFNIFLDKDIIILTFLKNSCSLCGSDGPTQKIKNNKKICESCIDWIDKNVIT